MKFCMNEHTICLLKIIFSSPSMIINSYLFFISMTKP